MGTYAYIIHKSKPLQVVFPDNVTRPVYRQTFLCKIQDLDDFLRDAWWAKRARALNATVARVESAWGSERPEFVVHCDSDTGQPYEDGPTVDLLLANGTFFHDGGDKPYSRPVGRLVRDGRKWRLMVPQAAGHD
jgi:hypothetical protein